MKVCCWNVVDFLKDSLLRTQIGGFGECPMDVGFRVFLVTPVCGTCG